MDQRDPDGLLRLPLDRVFTIKGFGTVVTGTLLAGTLRPGDEVAVLPADVKAKVRSVQVHSEEQAQAVAGQRTAVNLGGVDRQAIGRGEVLVHPGSLAPSPMIDAEVSLLPGARKPLPARSKVLFHVGTRQQEATCSLLDVKRLEPGGTALAQLSFDLPVVALPADRFILRGFHKQENYGTTIGGGQVLRVLSRRLRPRNTAAWALLKGMAAATAAERVALELLGAGPHGADPGPAATTAALRPQGARQGPDQAAQLGPGRGLRQGERRRGARRSLRRAARPHPGADGRLPRRQPAGARHRP